MIIGKLIPAATGLKRYRQIGIGPSDSSPRTSTRGRRRRPSCLAALEEIGGDGDGLDLEALGLTFGGHSRRRRDELARRRRGDRGTRGRLAARRGRPVLSD